jgi:hypothetical protein
MKSLVSTALSLGLLFGTLLAPLSANAQAVPVIDAANLQQAIRHDALSEGYERQTMTSAAATSQNTATIAQQQVDEFNKQQLQYQQDHKDVSTLFSPGNFGQIMSSFKSLLNQVKQNTSIISSDMSTNANVLADFNKLVPSYNSQSQTYANYLATIKKNANAQYAQALSLTQSQLQLEGGVQGAVGSITGNSPTNTLEGVEQLIALAKIQVGQMDSLIKIQSSMLKSMSVKYAETTGSGGSSTPSLNAQDKVAANAYCAKTVPGFFVMTPLAQQQAFAQCQTQMQQAAATQGGS